MKTLAPFSQVDFSQELKVVTFRLAGDRCLYFDRRVLMGQSEYFREMLATSVWQESRTGGLVVQHGSRIFFPRLIFRIHFWIHVQYVLVPSGTIWYLLFLQMPDQYRSIMILPDDRKG